MIRSVAIAISFLASAAAAETAPVTIVIHGGAGGFRSPVHDRGVEFILAGAREDRALARIKKRRVLHHHDRR